jgi:hypothetical protein
MRSKRILVIAVAIFAAVALFLINANLNVLSNLVAADLQDWNRENRILVWSVTGGLVLVGAILTSISVWLSSKREADVTQENLTSQNDAMAVLRKLYEEYRVSPGDKVNSERLRRQLDLSEQVLIDLIKKLEERDFVEATWVGHIALLVITEDGVALFKES